MAGEGAMQGRGEADGDGPELIVLAGALALAAASIVALWSKGGFGPAWLSPTLDICAAAFLGFVLIVAMRARLSAARLDDEPTSWTGAALIAAGFAGLLIGAAAGLLYAVSTKHGVYQPFEDAPTRAQILIFFVDEALKGAAFDLFEVFGVSLPGAPAFDAETRWGFGLAVALYRGAAALTTWSLVFALAARSRASAGPQRTARPRSR